MASRLPRDNHISVSLTVYMSFFITQEYEAFSLKGLSVEHFPNG